MIAIEEDLTNRIKESDLLKAEKDAAIAEATRLAQDLKEAQFQATTMKEELKQAS